MEHAMLRFALLATAANALPNIKMTKENAHAAALTLDTPNMPAASFSTMLATPTAALSQDTKALQPQSSSALAQAWTCSSTPDSAWTSSPPESLNLLMRAQKVTFVNRVQHLHFSGCAGTSVRMFAESLGIPVNKASNGNEGCSSAQRNWPDGMQEGASRCRCSDEGSWKYRWQASENPPMAALGCPGVDYWVVLREPVSRILSRVYKKHWDTGLIKTALTQTVWLKEPRCKELSGSASLSNYYVRGLAGPDAFRQDLTKVNESHYHAALSALQKFTVVLPLSNLSSLPVLLGMPATVKVPVEVTGQHAEVPDAVDEEMLKLIQERNKYDIRLYAAAQKLFKKAMMQARSPGFAARLKRGQAL
jgi:hypothetical protein